MTISSTDRVTGAQLIPLDDAACRDWIAHATASASSTAVPSANISEFPWLLAHCDDGVVWGRREVSGWLLSSTVYPGISPKPSAVNLQQLRLFGPQAEVFIWRTCDGFQGRELRDDNSMPCEEDLRADDEDRLLLGDRVVWDENISGHTPSIKGFTLIGDGKGSRHAVPIACSPLDFGGARDRKWPLWLKVKHYFTRDDETGLVRVAVTRLVNVFERSENSRP